MLLSEAIIANRGGDWRIVENYRQVIERWNAEFYQLHRLNPLNYDNTNEIDDSSETLQVAFQRAQAQKGMPALPFPDGVFDDLTMVSHYSDQTYHSPFDYWDDQGLHLRYPEEWPDLHKAV